jgi:hypothetical protein
MSSIFKTERCAKLVLCPFFFEKAATEDDENKSGVGKAMINSQAQAIAKPKLKFVKPNIQLLLFQCIREWADEGVLIFLRVTDEYVPLHA